MAKYFCFANNREEITEAIKWAKQKNMPFFILAGGSNVLINDGKFKGVVIKMKNEKLKIENQNEKFKIIKAEAGVPLGKIVGLALQNSLTGMEWAMGIPGTIGGAVYGNAGAFGKSMADVVEEIEVCRAQPSKKLGLSSGEDWALQTFKNKECQFGYRDSIFKRDKNLIILSVKIKLQTGDKAEIEKKMDNFFKIKKQTQPLEFFSAGSIFKNPEKLKVAELIEKAGLKGKRISGAEISQKHANFIVSNGRASARDVKKLIDLIKKQVKKKFNIILEEEIQYLNF